MNIEWEPTELEHGERVVVRVERVPRRELRDLDRVH